MCSDSQHFICVSAGVNEEDELKSEISLVHEIALKRSMPVEFEVCTHQHSCSSLVKDHSDSEKGNLLPPHRLLLSISSKVSFICTIPQTG